MIDHRGLSPEIEVLIALFGVGGVAGRIVRTCENFLAKVSDLEATPRGDRTFFRLFPRRRGRGASPDACTSQALWPLPLWCGRNDLHSLTDDGTALLARHGGHYIQGRKLCEVVPMSHDVRWYMAVECRELLRDWTGHSIHRAGRGAMRGA